MDYSLTRYKKHLSNWGQRLDTLNIRTRVLIWGQLVVSLLNIALVLHGSFWQGVLLLPIVSLLSSSYFLSAKSLRESVDKLRRRTLLLFPIIDSLPIWAFILRLHNIEYWLPLMLYGSGLALFFSYSLYNSAKSYHAEEISNYRLRLFSIYLVVQLFFALIGNIVLYLVPLFIFGQLPTLIKHYNGQTTAKPATLKSSNKKTAAKKSSNAKKPVRKKAPR